MSACHASGSSQQPSDHSSQLLLFSFQFSLLLIFRALQELLIFFQQLNYCKCYEDFNNVWSILSETTSQALYITDPQCFHLEHRANAQDDENWTHWTFLYVLCYDRLISDIKWQERNPKNLTWGHTLSFCCSKFTWATVGKMEGKKKNWERKPEEQTAVLNSFYAIHLWQRSKW